MYNNNKPPVAHIICIYTVSYGIIHCTIWGGSWNGGTPKSIFLMGFSTINHPFGPFSGTSIMETPIWEFGITHCAMGKHIIPFTMKLDLNTEYIFHHFSKKNNTSWLANHAEDTAAAITFRGTEDVATCLTVFEWILLDPYRLLHVAAVSQHMGQVWLTKNIKNVIVLAHKDC